VPRHRSCAQLKSAVRERLWATIQDALADRIVVSINKAALTEIENTYLNIGAGERVHGKGAARLQVKDLVLAFMAYHESMHEPYQNAFNTVALSS
jgi:hypothetical protein